MKLPLQKDGTIFVTDSFSPVIYRISSDLDTAEVFVEDAQFSEGKGFKLNGIHIVEDTYLVVAKSNSGELFRIRYEDKRSISNYASRRT